MSNRQTVISADVIQQGVMDVNSGAGINFSPTAARHRGDQGCLAVYSHDATSAFRAAMSVIDAIVQDNPSHDAGDISRSIEVQIDSDGEVTVYFPTFTTD